ncbi:MAG: ribonuclease HI family protein [Bdellovibrionales bacterium]|nr:ribonuclease HI family protein [Bdellovibrionales bacterium]
MKKYRIFVDGASRGNPGQASIGVSILNADGEEIGSISKKIGKATNNVAEYSALVEALEWAKEQSLDSVEVLADSELMVKQIKKEYRVKDPTLKVKWERATKAILSFKSFTIKHVPRAQNKRADELANLALDS